MSTYHYAPGAIHNDNHKEVSINLSSDDAAKFMKDFLSDNPTADMDTNKKDATLVVPIPQEGKYSEVRKYLDERKKFDAEFKEFCNSHSLRDLCARLSKEFGWFVDEHSLGANLNRNR